MQAAGVPQDSLKAKTSTFEVPTDENTTKIPREDLQRVEKKTREDLRRERKKRREDPQREKKRMKMWAGEGKKSATLRASHLFWVWVPTLRLPIFGPPKFRAPTLQAPSFCFLVLTPLGSHNSHPHPVSGFGRPPLRVPHPSGPHPPPQSQKSQKLAVAKVGLVVAKQGRGQTRSWPNKVVAKLGRGQTE